MGCIIVFVITCMDLVFHALDSDPIPIFAYQICLHRRRQLTLLRRTTLKLTLPVVAGAKALAEAAKATVAAAANFILIVVLLVGKL